jgi:hypothetical protein
LFIVKDTKFLFIYLFIFLTEKKESGHSQKEKERRKRSVDCGGWQAAAARRMHGATFPVKRGGRA